MTRNGVPVPPSSLGLEIHQRPAIGYSLDPDIVEDAKWRRPANPLGAAVFEHDGIVCAGVILKERVRLVLWNGSSLPDPHGLFNAQLEGNKSRAIDFHDGDDLKARGLTALIRAGVKHNRARVKPVRRKR